MSAPSTRLAATQELRAGSTDVARDAATRLFESVHELTGGSMSPTLERGWAVRVEPLNGPLEYGDVIRIDTARGPLIHRYLGTVVRGAAPQEHVVHAGDSSILPGVVPSSQVSGRVCAVVRPGGRPLLTLRDLPPSVQRRLARFIARERLYARWHDLAEAIPGLRPTPAGIAGRWVRRLLRLG